jgi:cysteine-rich repeat protein
MKSTSGSKVEAKGALLASGGFRFPLAATPPFTCDAAHHGYAYLNTTSNRLFVCNGIWRAVLLQECGNGVVEFGEACDSGASNSDTAADACRKSCVKATCGDGVKDSGEACDDGNKVDTDGCRSDCSLPCSGWTYKGVCLMASTMSGNQDYVPSGCKPYQPVAGWGQSDYVAICEHFKAGGTTCGAVDMDADGGRCGNFQAIASWESNTNPDVWVHQATFSWQPTSGSQNCNLYSATGRVVYACK